MIKFLRNYKDYTKEDVVDKEEFKEEELEFLLKTSTVQEVSKNKKKGKTAENGESEKNKVITALKERVEDLKRENKELKENQAVASEDTVNALEAEIKNLQEKLEVAENDKKVLEKEVETLKKKSGK